LKGLLAAGNDGTRFRRDAAVMWRHIKDTGPITDQQGAEAMDNLLAATGGPDGSRCSLTKFTGGWRRGDLAPDPTEAERQAMTLHLAPAVGALVTEALARSGSDQGGYGAGAKPSQGAWPVICQGMAAPSVGGGP